MRSRGRSQLLRLLSWACIVGAATLVATGSLIAWKQQQASQPHSPETLPLTTIDEIAEQPGTEKPKPSEFDSHTVATDLPRYLFIPKLSVRAMIKPVGLTKNNHIDAPKNIFDVGWYTKSSKPGKKGATLLDGHVFGKSVRGIFYNLKDLRTGDILTLERGDGALLNFRVVTLKEYDANNVDMNAALSPISSRAGLNLITCSGNVIKGSNNYDKRLVVFTEQL